MTGGEWVEKRTWRTYKSYGYRDDAALGLPGLKKEHPEKGPC